MGACVMLPQQIAPKVALEIAPDRVDVIGLVLDIVVFDDEIGTLDTVIMRFTPFQASGPPVSSGSALSDRSTASSRPSGSMTMAVT